MATPKFDAIISEFRARVSDPAVFVGGVLQDGNIIPAVDTVAYVNRAHLLLFHDGWNAAVQSAQGDDLQAKWKFIAAFPEMIAEVSGSVFSQP